MKKKYSKPAVELETFRLSASIAQSCGIPINFTENECSYGNGRYFLDLCAINMEGPDPAGTFCYHGPLDATSFINS